VQVDLPDYEVGAMALVDSGNLVGDLVSEEFARAAGLEYAIDGHPRVNTAAKGERVEIVGRCAQVVLQITGIRAPITLEPWVARELAHPVNLGLDFLGRYRGGLEYQAGGPYLRLGRERVKLVSRTPPAGLSRKRPSHPHPRGDLVRSNPKPRPAPEEPTATPAPQQVSPSPPAAALGATIPLEGCT